MTTATVEHVLEYWFSGSVRDLYGNLWFCSGERQRAADDEVELRFGHTLEEAVQGALQSWTTSTRGRIALIIVLDQFSRHVYRRQGVPEGNAVRRRTDELARAESDALIQLPDWDSGLSTREYVFALMPLRHSGELTQYRRLATLIDRRQRLQEDDAELLLKFRRQTTRRMQHLDERARAAGADSILERQEFVTDEADMHREQLVATTRAFLMRQPVFQRPSPVFISLSGGVDSMVLGKILVHLRDGGDSSVGDVIAIHVDYGNREESAAEAEYVSQWCGRQGIRFVCRRITEVRRGITARDDFERISRELRYSTYHEAISANKHADDTVESYGVIFGHHQGDLQENVISNVMRGCSPLQLSGMSESSLINGVYVWRPLLPHLKEHILEFAHKYGVPYFRDTTPEWSTRGKLRQLLVPLLTDMYGVGFLSNLSALAVASDANRQLVHRSLYAPFLAAVISASCGLRVPVASYAMQPVCFWSEMLKELMHSLTMPMVRARSVGSFVEYIQRRFPDRSTGRLLESREAVWLELRKGCHSCITGDGELVVFRDAALGFSAEIRDLLDVGLEELACGRKVLCGVWRVRAIPLDEVFASDAEEEYSLGPDALSAVLQGAFSYVIRPLFGVRRLCLEGASAVADWVSVRGRDRKRCGERGKSVFRGLDSRLRTGLPLLVEAGELIVDAGGGIEMRQGTALRLFYEYNEAK